MYIRYLIGGTLKVTLNEMNVFTCLLRLPRRARPFALSFQVFRCPFLERHRDHRDVPITLSLSPPPRSVLLFSSFLPYICRTVYHNA